MAPTFTWQTFGLRKGFSKKPLKITFKPRNNNMHNSQAAYASSQWFY